MSVRAVRVIVQARMSSRRFPGKVLAPLNGKPIIAHLIDRISGWIDPERIVVATSIEAADDPLTSYIEGLGISVFRGSMDNVYERFQRCLKRHPCSWFFRICGDSPLFDVEVMRRLDAQPKRETFDLVTNVQVRTFPKGQSAELIKSNTFSRIDPSSLTSEEREHVTAHYYANPNKYRILNVESGDPALAKMNFCIDTIEDLKRLETGAAESDGSINVQT